MEQTPQIPCIMEIKIFFHENKVDIDNWQMLDLLHE